jgi:hypothetical protein
MKKSTSLYLGNTKRLLAATSLVTLVTPFFRDRQARATSVRYVVRAIATPEEAL